MCSRKFSTVRFVYGFNRHAAFSQLVNICAPPGRWFGQGSAAFRSRLCQSVKGIRFTAEFKQDAVAQVVERDYAVSEVAERLFVRMTRVRTMS